MLLFVLFVCYLAVLGLFAALGLSLVAARRGCSVAVVHGLLIAVASLVEHGLWGTQASVVVAHGLSSCGSQAQ